MYANHNKFQLSKDKSQINSKYQILKNQTIFNQQIFNFHLIQTYFAGFEICKLRIGFYLFFAICLLLFHFSSMHTKQTMLTSEHLHIRRNPFFRNYN